MKPILNNDNFRYCVSFLKNAGEKSRAIRLVCDASGLDIRSGLHWVEDLKLKKPLSHNRELCWLCGKPGPRRTDFIEAVVMCETPGGKRCKPKPVKVHFSCWQDQDA